MRRNVIAMDFCPQGRAGAYCGMAVPFLTIVLLVLAGLLTLGCGSLGGTKVEEGEMDEIKSLIYSVADLAADSARFKGMFASDSVPDNELRREYGTLMFDLVEEPKVTDGVATIAVVVRQGVTDVEIGQVEWTAVKEGDSWKLKTAPLPAK